MIIEQEDQYEFLAVTVPALAKRLTADSKPLWGKMSAQHMVEHLISIVRCSNGRFDVAVVTPTEKLPRYYEFLMTDDPFKPGTKSPAMGDELQPLRCTSLDEALGKLHGAIEHFFGYHGANPEMKPTHPVFGPLDFSEWIHFHAKHSRHHLIQFGLLPVPNHPFFAEIAAS